MLCFVLIHKIRTLLTALQKFKTLKLGKSGSPPYVTPYAKSRERKLKLQIIAFFGKKEQIL